MIHRVPPTLASVRQNVSSHNGSSVGLTTVLRAGMTEVTGVRVSTACRAQAWWYTSGCADRCFEVRNLPTCIAVTRFARSDAVSVHDGPWAQITSAQKGLPRFGFSAASSHVTVADSPGSVELRPSGAAGPRSVSRDEADQVSHPFSDKSAK
jgi:hypothetical protein